MVKNLPDRKAGKTTEAPVEMCSKEMSEEKEDLELFLTEHRKMKKAERGKVKEKKEERPFLRKSIHEMANDCFSRSLFSLPHHDVRASA